MMFYWSQDQLIYHQIMPFSSALCHDNILYNTLQTTSKKGRGFQFDYILYDYSDLCPPISMFLSLLKKYLTNCPTLNLKIRGVKLDDEHFTHFRNGKWVKCNFKFFKKKIMQSVNTSVNNLFIIQISVVNTDCDKF